MAQPAKPIVSWPTSPSPRAVASFRARASIPPTRKLVKTKSAPSTHSSTESHGADVDALRETVRQRGDEAPAAPGPVS